MVAIPQFDLRSKVTQLSGDPGSSQAPKPVLGLGLNQSGVLRHGSEEERKIVDHDRDVDRRGSARP